MPTPMDQRCYHEKLEDKGGIPQIDDGEYLIETIGPWCTWIGEWGADVHSTKFAPPDQIWVTQEMAERLENGGAAVILRKPEADGDELFTERAVELPAEEPEPEVEAEAEAPKTKTGRPRKTKALKPDENK